MLRVVRPGYARALILRTRIGFSKRFISRTIPVYEAPWERKRDILNRRQKLSPLLVKFASLSQDAESVPAVRCATTTLIYFLELTEQIPEDESRKDLFAYAGKLRLLLEYIMRKPSYTRTTALKSFDSTMKTLCEDMLGHILSTGASPAFMTSILAEGQVSYVFRRLRRETAKLCDAIDNPPQNKEWFDTLKTTTPPASFGLKQLSDQDDTMTPTRKYKR